MLVEFVPLPTPEPLTTTEMPTTTETPATTTTQSDTMTMEAPTAIEQTPESDDSTRPWDTDTTTEGNDGSTATENVSQEHAGGGNGNNTEDFIAIVFGVLILLITVLVVAGIIGCWIRRKQKKGKM